MDEIFRKLRLTDSFTIELYIEKSKLVQVFSEQMDYSDLRLFTDLFEELLLDKKKYKGLVSEEGFEIKRRRRFFLPGNIIAEARGTFSQRGQLTIIETQIDGRHPLIIFGLIVVLAVSVVFIADMALRGDWTSPLLPGILAYIAVAFSTFYFLMRWNVSRLKNDLEREIREWVK